MVESIAIMEYPIGRYGPAAMAPAPTDASYPHHKQPCCLARRASGPISISWSRAASSRPIRTRINGGWRQAVQMFQNRLALVSRRLDEVRYVAGKAFTAADISFWYAVELGSTIAIGDQYARLSSHAWSGCGPAMLASAE